MRPPWTIQPYNRFRHPNHHENKAFRRGRDFDNATALRNIRHLSEVGESVSCCSNHISVREELFIMKVNGQEIPYQPSLTLDMLLTTLGYRLDTIVVEQNGQIISKTQFSTTPVQAEDIIEVVGFIGGG